MWLLGAAFLGSVFIGAQPLAQRMLQPVIGDVQVDRRSWLKVNATSPGQRGDLGEGQVVWTHRRNVPVPAGPGLVAAFFESRRY